MRKLPVLVITLVALTSAAVALGRPHHRLIVQPWLADITPVQTSPLPAPTQNTPTQHTSNWAQALITAAEAQVGITTIYDGAYRGLSYPGGDIERTRGVCTDVVIRALRDAHGFDLQKAVHEDMSRAFSKYPRNWGLTRPDRNIDHRRVPNLRRFLSRRGAALPAPDQTTVFLPGDLVTWTLGPGLPHIGIVSNHMVPGTSRPLIIHNVGAGTRIEDFLFAYPMTGHYRTEGRL